MQETDEELRDIKREIIEARGLVIRTNNLTNALAADIKSIAKRQSTYERRITWNSATAYVVFVVVIFGALKLLVDARVDAIEAKYRQMGGESGSLKKEIETLQKREAERATAEAESTAFYELIHANKRAELIQKFETFEPLTLTHAEHELFRDAVEKARNDLALSLYQQGQDSLRLQRWQEAATAFEESLKYREESAISPSANYGLASAYRKLKRQKDSIPLLMQVSEQTIDKELQDDALELLAQCQMEQEAWNDAKATWRTLARRFPDTHFAAIAKMQLAQLNVYH